MVLCTYQFMTNDFVVKFRLSKKATKFERKSST
jgi:hypothetical protein